MLKKGVLLLVALCGVALVTPACAQNSSEPFQYSAVTRLMNSGKYRAEVWRHNVVTGAEELAWSNSVLHSTLTMAMGEACTSIQKYFDASFSCPRAVSQETVMPAPVARAKATPRTTLAPDGRPNPWITLAAKMAKVQRPVAPGRPLISSPSGAPALGTRDFWDYYDRWRGGGGGGGGEGGGGGAE
jgi:hypothetical protein